MSNEKAAEKGKDLSEQVRFQITEFYTISGAFILANTFVSAIQTNHGNGVYFLWGLLAMNFVWYVLLVLSKEWTNYWIAQARADQGSIYFNKDVRYTIGQWGVKDWFMTLPFIFSLVEAAIWCRHFSLTEAAFAFLLAVLVYIAVPRLVAKTSITPTQ